MEYRELGRTGVRVSELCLGTAFRSQDDEQTCVRIIERALDHCVLLPGPAVHASMVAVACASGFKQCCALMESQLAWLTLLA